MAPLTPQDRADWSEGHTDGHPTDHRWPRAVRMLFILGSAVLALLLVAVGGSALVDAAREVVS